MPIVMRICVIALASLALVASQEEPAEVVPDCMCKDFENSAQPQDAFYCEATALEKCYRAYTDPCQGDKTKCAGPVEIPGCSCTALASDANSAEDDFYCEGDGMCHANYGGFCPGGQSKCAGPVILPCACTNFPGDQLPTDDFYCEQAGACYGTQADGSCGGGQKKCEGPLVIPQCTCTDFQNAESLEEGFYCEQSGVCSGTPDGGLCAGGQTKCQGPVVIPECGCRDFANTNSPTDDFYCEQEGVCYGNYGGVCGSDQTKCKGPVDLQTCSCTDFQNPNDPADPFYCEESDYCYRAYGAACPGDRTPCTGDIEVSVATCTCTDFERPNESPDAYYCGAGSDYCTRMQDGENCPNGDKCAAPASVDLCGCTDFENPDQTQDSFYCEQGDFCYRVGDGPCQGETTKLCRGPVAITVDDCTCTDFERPNDDQDSFYCGAGSSYCTRTDWSGGCPNGDKCKGPVELEACTCTDFENAEQDQDLLYCQESGYCYRFHGGCQGERTTCKGPVTIDVEDCTCTDVEFANQEELFYCQAEESTFCTMAWNGNCPPGDKCAGPAKIPDCTACTDFERANFQQDDLFCERSGFCYRNWGADCPGEPGARGTCKGPVTIDVDDCSCTKHFQPGMLDEAFHCQSGDGTVCRVSDENGDCTAGDTPNKCAGPIDVSSFKLCGGCEKRHSAGYGDELWCFENAEETACRTTMWGCSQEDLCVNCDLSFCEERFGEETDTVVRAHCEEKGRWSCCMEKSQCKECTDPVDCFDCMHNEAKIGACCDEQSITDEVCGNWMPECDLSHCSDNFAGEGDVADCETDERLLCCVAEKWECLACRDYACQLDCWDRMRIECCAELGIGGEAEACTGVDFAGTGLDVKFYDLRDNFPTDLQVDFSALGEPFYETVKLGQARQEGTDWLILPNELRGGFEEDYFASLWTGYLVIGTEHWARIRLRRVNNHGAGKVFVDGVERQRGDRFLLTVGRHDLRLEVVEDTGDARVRLQYRFSDDADGTNEGGWTVIPPGVLSRGYPVVAPAPAAAP